MRTKYFFFLLLFFQAFTEANAANIGPAYDINGTPIGGLLIEGEIKKGDFQKFAAYALSSTGVSSIFLASPGGDLNESMQIGKLVRALYYSTWAPIRNKPFIRLEDKKNNVCASSCFFIYVAGISQAGYKVGIHRPYLSDAAYKELDIKSAVNRHEHIKEVVSTYLAEMGVPSHYLDDMLAVPSGGVRWLTKAQIDKDFSGRYSPALEEWLRANCPKIIHSVEDEKRYELIINRIPANKRDLSITESISDPDDLRFVRKYREADMNHIYCGFEKIENAREAAKKALLEKIRKNY